MNKRLRGHLWRIVHPVVAIRGELARWRLRATPPRPSPPYREHFAAGYTEADVEAMRGSWHVSAPGSHLIDEAPDPAGATMPSPKMLREAANILETAPYRRMKTAAWLRYVAGQVEELDREEAAEGLDDRALADTTLAYHEAQWAGRCCEVGPAGYLCTEPIPHETAHVSTAPNGTEFDAWVTADLPWLANEQAAGRCAAINEGRRYVCSLERGHAGAHTALATPDPEAGDEVVDTWIG